MKGWATMAQRSTADQALRIDRVSSICREAPSRTPRQFLRAREREIREGASEVVLAAHFELRGPADLDGRAGTGSAVRPHSRRRQVAMEAMFGRRQRMPQGRHRLNRRGAAALRAGQARYAGGAGSRRWRACRASHAWRRFRRSQSCLGRAPWSPRDPAPAARLAAGPRSVTAQRPVALPR
jgi:hypothetical protein